MRPTVPVCCALVLLLGGCDARFGQEGPLVSGTSVEHARASNTMPEPINSLPVDAEGIGTGPNAVEPNAASVTLGTERRGQAY